MVRWWHCCFFHGPNGWIVGPSPLYTAHTACDWCERRQRQSNLSMHRFPPWPIVLIIIMDTRLSIYCITRRICDCLTEPAIFMSRKTHSTQPVRECGSGRLPALMLYPNDQFVYLCSMQMAERLRPLRPLKLRGSPTPRVKLELRIEGEMVTRRIDPDARGSLPSPQHEAIARWLSSASFHAERSLQKAMSSSPCSSSCQITCAQSKKNRPGESSMVSPCFTANAWLMWEIPSEAQPMYKYVMPQLRFCRSHIGSAYFQFHHSVTRLSV